MAESKVAGRYAKSLLGLAAERKQADKINSDMELILKTIESSRDLGLLLKNPIINSDKKEAVILAIFGDKIDAVTLAFINIVIRKHRENYLEDVSRQFISLYKQMSGVETATIITATPLNDELRKEVMELIKKSVPGKQVELKEKIDKDVIGGFIIRIGDRQYDTTISSKLRELRKEMKINLYEKNY